MKIRPLKKLLKNFNYIQMNNIKRLFEILPKKTKSKLYIFIETL